MSWWRRRKKTGPEPTVLLGTRREHSEYFRLMGEAYTCLHEDFTVGQLAEMIFFHKIDLKMAGRPDLAEVAHVCVDERGWLSISYAPRGAGKQAPEVEQALSRIQGPLRVLPLELGEALYEATKWPVA